MTPPTRSSRARSESVSEGSNAQRVEKALRELIDGSQEGERLPSVRELVGRYGASPVTVSRVLLKLKGEGHIVTQPGRGTFVAAPPRAVSAADLDWQALLLGPRSPARDLAQLVSEPHAGVLPLGSGYPDSALQAHAELALAMRRALSRRDVWERVPTEGIPALRQWFARALGPSYSESDVLIVPGGQSALSAIFRGLLQPGDGLIVESPTYVGALSLGEALGLQLFPLPCDRKGMRTDLLRALLLDSGARVIYCQPTYSNPTGVSMALQRREELLSIAREFGAFIIEDDYARELSHEGQPPPPLCHADDGHVIYVRSLTKAAAPSLRVAAIVARGPIMTRLKRARLLEDFFVAGPMQWAALEFVSRGSYLRHLQRVQQELAARTDLVVRYLRTHETPVHLQSRPSGGFSLWLELAPEMDEATFVQAALASGVALTPGRLWFPAEAPGAFVRLSVAGASREQLSQGLRRLWG